MKRILITLFILITVLSVNGSDYKKIVRENFHKADSCFHSTHQKEIAELESKVNLSLKKIQSYLHKSNIDCKIKQVIYRKSRGNFKPAIK